MFINGDRKKRSPALIMTIGALAAVGVASLVRGGRRIVMNMADKMRSFTDEGCDHS